MQWTTALRAPKVLILRRRRRYSASTSRSRTAPVIPSSANLAVSSSGGGRLTPGILAIAWSAWRCMKKLVTSVMDHHHGSRSMRDAMCGVRMLCVVGDKEVVDVASSQLGSRNEGNSTVAERVRVEGCKLCGVFCKESEVV